MYVGMYMHRRMYRSLHALRHANKLCKRIALGGDINPSACKLYNYVAV